jgi:ribonuclease HII
MIQQLHFRNFTFSLQILIMLRSCYNSLVVEAGLDEAGRGCLAGPVTAAAVILPKGYKHNLLNDSKQLTKKQRDAITYAVAECTPEEIDEINILKASFLAMHRAIEKLDNVPEHLLIDGNRFTPYPMVPHTCIIKGDTKFLSIAAASILAKTYRDEYMEEIAQEFPMYSWHTNAGYPTPPHRNAIRAHGITKYHRKTFRHLPEGN